jgi:hypothetical protein
VKIELNGVYRTRSGKKCRIICVDLKNPDRTIVGLVDLVDQECVEFYTLGGRVYSAPNVMSDGDLISEWVEPKPRMLAWICADNFQGDGTPLASTGYSVRYFDNGLSPNYGKRAPWLDEPEEGEE